MKLVTFSIPGHGYRAGVVAGDMVVDIARASAAAELASPLPDKVLEILELGEDGFQAVRTLLDQAERLSSGGAAAAEPLLHRLSDVQLSSPVRHPEKILGVGLNYRDHCHEMGRELPKELRIFAMFANGLIGSGEAIALPRSSSKMDWEAELVAVIGRPTKHVSAEQALDHVAGFMVGNDVSARDHQAADPLTMRGKCGDTHAPVGPWLVTRDELPDPDELPIELRVNGEVKQSSNTNQLVFSVSEIVAFLSQYYTLKPGDLIFTGTPAGVGAGRKPPEWLKPGDNIDVTIGRIGTLSNKCVAE